MALAFSQSQLQAVSSAVQKQLLRSEHMDVFTTALGDQWIDPLSPAVINIINTARKNTTLYSYVGGKPLTTVSFELYDTTSAWWIILYINGYMHPDEISDGATLKVPTTDVIQTLLQVSAQNNRGTQVTI